MTVRLTLTYDRIVIVLSVHLVKTNENSQCPFSNYNILKTSNGKSLPNSPMCPLLRSTES